MYTFTTPRPKGLHYVGFIRKSSLLLFLMFWSAMVWAQVNTGGSANTSSHNKQVIGYITNWDAWKDTKAGVPAQGALTHMNIDYSKYTILNYSFFGVARDGSLHSGDHRNKSIYQEGVSQEPADIFFTDVYSSWDLHILFGELENANYISEDVKTRAEAQGFVVEVGGSTWEHPGWGLSGALPLPLHKEGGAKGLLDMAHENNVKVMASIGGWSMCKHFPEMAADPVKRARFIEDCKKLINAGFDGIDLDWEYPGPYAGMNFTGTEADFVNFTNLVQEIRTAIGPDKLITSAFSAAPNKIENLEWSKLAQTMDYFNFMTYDFNGGWSNIAGHNAPLYTYDGAEAAFSWKATLDKLKELGVPSNKICFGIPFYGRGVITDGAAALNAPTKKRQETVQPDGPITTCADYTNWPKEVYDGTPNYFFIKQKALGANSGWTRHWDDQAKVPYLTNGNYFLSYDDEESIGHKAAFINDNDLAGTIVWTVYGDLEISGSATSYGSKLKRWSNVSSELINKTHAVFAEGSVGLPQVTLTAPANGTNFSSGTAITLEASATDANGSISKVEFYNGNTKLGEDTSAPYSYTWSGAADGNYSVSARAYDNENNQANSNAASISVGSVIGQPTVVLTSPANGAAYNENDNIVVSADASATGGTVSKVDFYQGTTLLGSDATAPYSITWQSVAIGSYSISATVTDSNGQTATSLSVSVEVKGAGGDCDGIPAWDSQTVYAAGGTLVSHNGRKYSNKWWTQGDEPGTGGDWGVWTDLGECPGGGNTAPTVSITSPANNASFTEGDEIQITANAEDADGSVAQVAFYADNTLLGTDTSAPYSYSWSNAPVGNAQLTAIATDNLGKTASSSVVAISITAIGGNVPPVVSITAPTDGAQVEEGQSITITASASDSDGSVSSVAFYAGSTLLSTDNSAPYTYAWNNAAVGSYVLTAIATDNEGASTTSSVVNVTVSGQTGDCTLPQYIAGTSYATGESVQNGGQEYNCKEGGWCSSSAAWAYEPGNGMYWQDAWSLVGDCGGNTGGNTAPTVSLTAPAPGAVYSTGQTIAIAANANDSDGSISKVEFYDGNTLLGSDTSSPYGYDYTNAALGAHALSAVAYDNENASTTSEVINVSVTSTPPGGGSLPSKILVGYWHNWQNNSAPYLRLNQVSDNYDVVNVSFAVPTSFTDMTMRFAPEEQDVVSFKSDMAALKARGTKVLISIGGANDPVELKTTEDRDKFVTSMIAIIEEYGFDGFDIDLEGSSVSLNPGDSDFKNSTTPKINNLVAATRSIVNHFGSDFILTMAPETFYVQAGFDSYGNGAGAYLPVIYGLMDKLTYIHVQHYNTGSMYGADNQIYQPATADFHVAMAEMLLTGFPIARNENNRFPALRPDQVAFGVPASTGAASSGYTSNAEVQKAMNYLINGVSFGGNYTLNNPSGYPAFRGLMTWSINWDAATGNSFSNSHAAFLNGQSSASNAKEGTLLTQVNQMDYGMGIQVYPNPIGPQANVELTLSNPGKAVITVLDQMGRTVKTVNKTSLNRGVHQFSIETSEFKKGVYYFKITTEEQSEIVRIVKH